MTAANAASSPADRKDLLQLAALSREEIVALLDAAARFANDPTAASQAKLTGKTLANLFFEASTRTMRSFELAAHRLGMYTLGFSSVGSSTAKGESLLDTAKTIESMGVDAVVVRHACAGSAHLLARHVRVPVINAGAGRQAHPTQGLIDLYTIRNRLGRLDDLHIAIVGDIRNSRVARSALGGLSKFENSFSLVGPPTLVPRSFARHRVVISHSLDDVLPDADVIMMLRVQRERLAGSAISSVEEYAHLYCLSVARLAQCKPDAIVMHPGPFNRGVEIASEVADGPRSTILEQVAAGVPVRMAVLARALSH
ncbi:MAG: aspartate carbamoyltransferase catalytic subunit [Phycisphaerae bacterium]